MRAKIELILAVIFLAGLLFVSRTINEQTTSGEIESREIKIIIDAGHGGSDPGKVATDGTVEKDINLTLAGKLKKLLEAQGINVIMTREKDEMLSAENSDHKKLEDMKARVELINGNMPELVVSIHQNSYSDESVKGAQVFYHQESREGKRAAELMQRALLEVDAGNHRQAKGNNDYYLLKHTEVPVIIVECGFLSNPKEAELLVNEEYQNQLAEAMRQGIVTYLKRK